MGNSENEYVLPNSETKLDMGNRSLYFSTLSQLLVTGCLIFYTYEHRVSEGFPRLSLHCPGNKVVEKDTSDLLNVQGKSLWYFQSGLVFVLWLGLKTAEPVLLAAFACGI